MQWSSKNERIIANPFTSTVNVEKTAGRYRGGGGDCPLRCIAVELTDHRNRTRANRFIRTRVTKSRRISGAATVEGFSKTDSNPRSEYSEIQSFILFRASVSSPPSTGECHVPSPRGPVRISFTDTVINDRLEMHKPSDIPRRARQMFTETICHI